MTRDGARPDDDPFYVPDWMDRLSGWVARNPRFWIRLGKLESRVLHDRLADVQVHKPCYIAGLARAGSTILLEHLARQPDVVTHRYRDFPLLFVPCWWNWFLDRSTRRPARSVERAHLDGIQITRDSPEAFEEVIWTGFFPHLHDLGSCSVMTSETRHREFEGFYVDHIRKLLFLRGATRYLSKGNYHVTRLSYVHKIFPDARFVVPIRNPLWHVASLMKQHRLFCEAGRRNARVTRHLGRAGHFEFGLDRRPIHTGDVGAVASVRRHWLNGNEVCGWAEYWRLVYDFLADTLASDADLRRATIVVRYEDLCRFPADTLAAILEHCDLPTGDLPARAAQSIRHPSYYRPEFSSSECEAIYCRTAETMRRFGYRDDLAA